MPFVIRNPDGTFRAKVRGNPCTPDLQKAGVWVRKWDAEKALDARHYWLRHGPAVPDGSVVREVRLVLVEET